MQAGLHDDREQRLIHPATALSSRDGKNDPARSLGIRNSRSPAVEVSVRSRCPLRCAVRPSVR